MRFPEVRRDLRHAHPLERVDGLEGLRLARLLATNRSHENVRRLLEAAEPVEVAVEVVRGELDRAVVAPTTPERATDIDPDHQRRTRGTLVTACRRARDERRERRTLRQPSH